MGTAYSVAVLTRGTGAYTYTYQGTAGLSRGTVCALSFRGSLELGVITGPDESPPQAGKLLSLIPVELPGQPGWGALLCDLAAATAATPREIAGYCLFGTPAQGLKQRLTLLEPDGLPARYRSAFADLSGQLTPSRRRKLMKSVPWRELSAAVEAGAVAVTAHVAGLPDVTRPQAKLARRYTIDPTTANLLGITQLAGRIVPGTYLTGLAADLDVLSLTPVRDAAGEEPADRTGPPEAVMDWQPLEWPEGWDVLGCFPGLSGVRLRRVQTTWERLRGGGGLPAELAAEINAGQRTLVIAPMAWMLERLWPALADWPSRVHRYRAESGPSAVAAVLGAAEREGQVVCGLEGAWKLAAYRRFDRVVMLDPTHPAYQPEGAPWLDPRIALWRVLAGTGARLDLVELGVSVFDGLTQLRQAAVMPPQEQGQQPEPPGDHVDLDPLPLHLRQPGRRRLVYFNRLGQGRALRCAECNHGVNCPQCNSQRLHYSGRHARYHCPDCGWRNDELLCRNCGTATLSAGLPGLEALTRRSGDTLVHGGSTSGKAHPETQSVFGTAKLLEPLAEFWPQEIVYVHADTKPGLMDDWHLAVDTVSRLCALYANPQLQYAYIVSAHLRGKLGNSLTHSQTASIFRQDMQLRRLAGLPPFGRLLRLRWRGQDRARIQAVAAKVLAVLSESTPEAMLGLGKPYRIKDGYNLAGYAVNPEIGEQELQRLRFQDKQVAMAVQVVNGPWGG